MSEQIVKKKGRPKKTIDPSIVKDDKIVEKKTGKRGRKTNVSFYTSNKLDKNSLVTSIQPPKLQILHLNIKEEEIIDNSSKLTSLNSFDNNLIQKQDDNEKYMKKIDDVIFQLFADYVDVWPSKTDVCCWWCCHTFTSLPLGIPINVKNNEFLVRGIFCSFPCLNSYNRLYNITQKQYLIKTLYSKLSGTSIYSKSLSYAPPREMLKMFGGLMSIDDFRTSDTENKTFQMIKYPMTYTKDYIQVIDTNKIKNANQYIFNNNDKNITNLDKNTIFQAQERLSKLNLNATTNTNSIEQYITH